MDTVTNIRPAASFPLPESDLESLGFRKGQIDRLIALIERHIAENRYPGCQIALARHGKLALYRSFGNASPIRNRARRPTTRCGCSTPTPRW